MRIAIIAQFNTGVFVAVLCTLMGCLVITYWAYVRQTRCGGRGNAVYALSTKDEHEFYIDL